MFSLKCAGQKGSPGPGVGNLFCDEDENVKCPYKGHAMAFTLNTDEQQSDASAICLRRQQNDPQSKEISYISYSSLAL